jgi:hypothetical protein
LESRQTKSGVRSRLSTADPNLHQRRVSMKRRRNRRCWRLCFKFRLLSTLRSSVRHRLRNAPFGGSRHFWRIFSFRSSEERRMAVFHPSARSLVRAAPRSLANATRMIRWATQLAAPFRARAQNELALAGGVDVASSQCGRMVAGWTARSRQATACRPGNASHAEIQCVVQAIRPLAAMPLKPRRRRRHLLI